MLSLSNKDTTKADFPDATQPNVWLPGNRRQCHEEMDVLAFYVRHGIST